MRSPSPRFISAFVVFGLTLSASNSFSTNGEQGFTVQGFDRQGFTVQGFTVQGTDPQGFTVQGFTVQGFTVQGTDPQGFTVQGFTVQGLNEQGFTVQGFTVQGFTVQGFTVQATPLLGIDRLRGVPGPMEYRGLAYANVQATSDDLQGLQSGAVTSYGVPASLAQAPTLQASPSDTGPGSYIFVAGLSGTVKDIEGTLWNMVLADSTGSAAIGLYVSDVSKDTMSNLSKYPSNDDVYLYTVYYRHPATQQWTSLCPVDAKTGKASAMAIPLDINDWTSPASRQKFTFACTATGVGSKCARNWGYKPWKSVTETVWTGAAFTSKAIPLKPFYDACVIAARADYCQDGQSYTKNGTLVDLFDTLDGFTSLNPTAGLPYTPGSPGPMMHEEYQISALDLASIGTPPAKPFYAIVPPEDLMSLPPEDQAALAALRRSGMQSSRHGDLDPGRSCLAAPYIDRCDPQEPYACYRDVNMSATPYGAFLSVNSPRHCDHDEDTVGAPLDPLCNLCVSRVCSVDPTCCGDPGDTFYPGSLAWDQRCVAIRDQVCRSSSAEPKWRAGTVADKPGSTPAVYLRGAIGAFEGIFTTGGVRYVEGWACDPDFPGASSPVQISVGGPMGAPGATLSTVNADLALRSTPGWRETVAAECGAGRHGFRFPLQTTFQGDIYVYGIDLNTPGAPFTLLRGGKKTVAAAGAPPTGLQAAIWTGWLQPSVSGRHSFSVATTPDKYRVWVNGAYVAGNWVDADASVPGAFTEQLSNPPPAPSLQKGVRYAVRIEYLRPSAIANAPALTLRWTPPGAAEADIPTTALYPAAPGSGNGLLGTYWNAAGTQNASKSLGAIDYVWTSCDPANLQCPRPAPGIRVEDAFKAQFEGQVVPPVSGDYLLTADTDGAARIFVNDVLVTDASRRPPGAGTPEVCGTRDICRPGTAISRTCDQGYFCAAQICVKDPACCSITWDAACVQEVATICNLECRPTAPVPVHLRAGAKHDIRVEFEHAGGNSRGARLKLFWALAGGARDAIPVDRLFATPSAPATPNGVGLNAAYFSDEFETEYLHRVEQVKFVVGAPAATASLGASIACGVPGAPACGTGDVLGPPALVDPAPQSRVVGPDVTLRVTGATVDATITVAEVTTGANGQPVSVPLTSFAYAPPADKTPMTSPPITLAYGPHKLTVAQSIPGKASVASAAVEFTVVTAPTDPTLPPAPPVTVPPGGHTTNTGTISVTGTATPNGKVNVSIGGAPPTTVNVPASGTWTATITLPGYGEHTISVTQTVGVKTSATGTQVTVKFAPPAITVSSPPATETAFSGSINVTGIVPEPANSKVIVADGDGRYFTEVQTLDIDGNGAFPPAGAPRPLTLDAGRHTLKIFQRLYNADGTVNMDGTPVERTVLITAAVGGLHVDCPSATPGGHKPDLTLTGGGAPARTGLRYGVVLYQGPTGGTLVKVGQTSVDDQGNFTLPVRFGGAGNQQVRARLLVSSLSGGGAAESGDSPVCTIAVKPSPPTITNPNPHSQASGLVTLSGKGLPGATIQVLLDETTDITPATAPKVAANTNYTAKVSIPRGAHVVTVKQRVDTAISDESSPLLVKFGDVLPPEFTFTNSPIINDVTTGEQGKQIDFIAASGLTVTDPTPPVTLTCVPAAPSFFFPLGTTNVICSAKDGVGNVRTTTLTVNVKSTATPEVTASNFVAEATGPEGAAVAYQVAATGFIANCAPPGSSAISPCSNWQRKSTGLGLPTGLVVDPVDGTLYAVRDPDFTSHPTFPLGTLMKWTQQGQTWTDVTPAVSVRRGVRMSVAPTTPSTLYVPVDAGLLASSNGGQTWKNVLPGAYLVATSVDPHDPKHLFAWNTWDRNDGSIGQLTLFETDDGGTSWRYAAENFPIETSPEFPYPRVSGVAFDPINRGRIYAVVGPVSWPDPSAPQVERIFRRVGNAPWERLPIPPVQDAARVQNPAIGVAPKLTPCDNAPCATHPTVFVGRLMSIDGGKEWVEPAGMEYGAQTILFDRHKDGYIYTDRYVSSNYGRDWQPWPTTGQTVFTNLQQDPAAPPSGNTARIYAEFSRGAAASGTLMTDDAGVTWNNVVAPIGGWHGIGDLAVDAVDPRIAYLISRNGLFRTGDGGDTWVRKTNDHLFETRLAIDPFDPNMVYLSIDRNTVEPGGHIFMSANGGTGDTLTHVLFGGIVAPDPAVRNLLYQLSDQGVVSRYAPPTNPSYALGVPAFKAVAIKVLPDAARTVAVSYYRTASQGGTLLFSGRDAPFAPTPTTVRHALTGAPARPVFDNSDGHNNIFVSGNALGSTPNFLYKAPLDTLEFGPPLGGGQPGIDFRRLVIDAGSGGTIMYTIGTDDALWQSQDGGRTWAKDAGGPPIVNQAWISPVDGALYVGQGTQHVTEATLQQLATSPNPAFTSTIWKRTPDTTPPPGASIIEGNLRVTCGGGSGRAVTSGSVFPIGTTNLTCVATDVFGATTTRLVAILVTDLTPPTITVSGPTEFLTTSTDPNVLVPANFTVTATDIVDGTLPVSCLPASGTPRPLGVTTVTCTARDAKGNQATASFPITVKRTGTTPAVPTLNVPAAAPLQATTLNPAGVPSVAANPTVSATRSTGAPLTPVCTPAWTATTLFPVGTTTESCSVTDSGFTVTKTFTVTVIDTQPPTFDPLPSPSVQAQGAWGAHVPYSVTAKDLGQPVTTSCVPASNSVFAPGTTTVTCRAVDKVGNVASANFNVVVQDLSPPVLTVPPLVVVEAQDLLGARATYTVSAVDTLGGTVPVDCVPASGSWFPFGDTPVSCQTVTAGNDASATFTVRVVDTTPPELVTPTAPIRLEATTPAGAPAPATFGETAFDLVSGKLTPVCTRSNGLNAVPIAAGTLLPMGDSTVTCAATDGAGNTATKSFHVIVGDTKGPVLTLPTTRFVQASASGTAFVTFPATIKATDLGVEVPVICTPPSGSRFLFGTTVVTCVARDAAGNETRGTFNVVVRDTVAPVMSGVPANITAYATTVAGAAVTYTTPTASDGVDGARPVACTPASGSTFAPSATTVSCSATDKSGNTVTRTFTVTIRFDTRQPDGSTFTSGFAADGSSVYGGNAPINVAFALTGVSAPITNLVARALVAPVSGGVPGTFVDATPASGTGNLFAYDAVARTYRFAMSKTSLVPGIYRFRADLGDGAPREVNFAIIDQSITITPTERNYGTVTVGGLVPALAHLFTVRNIGAVATSLTTTLTVTIGGPGEFQITGIPCTSVAPGASCMLSAEFRPNTPGPKHATLTVTASDGSVATSELDGFGASPAQLLVSPQSGSLGTAPLFTQSATAGDVTVSNVGDNVSGPITVSSTNPEFQFDNQCPPAGLPGHQTCHVIVTFRPTAIGNRTATLNISASPGGPRSVALSGVGTSGLVISPTSKAFPGSPVNVPGTSQVFTVTNVSAQTSTTHTTTVSPASFRVTADTCAGRTLTAGASCAVTIQFHPTIGGPIAGSLTVDGGVGSATASLTGTGVIIF
jgi:photosystem II stability/assembly factor-like uncharacterized protein